MCNMYLSCSSRRGFRQMGSCCPVKISIIFLALTLFSLLNASPVMSWEFAVTTKNKIIFYDEKWSEITSAAHQFDELSAIAFDESQEEIYFNDHFHNNGSIFSVKLSRGNDGNHQTERILSKTQNETIAAMVFDPVDHYLYWTDMYNRKIYRMLVQTETLNPQPEVIIDFADGDERPDGIAIDFCRRKIYWSNSNHKSATIERASLSGGQREVLIDTGFLPHGIVVDQHSHRIYWVDDQSGIHYSIESANLDGSDHTTLYTGKHGVPVSLTVTQSNIYWTDVTDNNAIWSLPKSPSNDSVPVKILTLPNKPKGLVARIGLFQKLENNVDCKDQVKKIHAYLLSPKVLDFTAEKDALRKRREYCLHNGEFSTVSGECVCKVGYTGRRCEIQDCHNYCVHGTCSMSTNGFPHCTCQEGFHGERCQTSKCANYCLNDGRCQIKDAEPVCECLDSHSGERCENNMTEVCLMYCKYGQNNTDWIQPPECPNSCDEEAFKNFQLRHFMRASEIKSSCSNRYNYTLIFTIIGVVVALTLTLLIIKTIRRMYKPARPRIRKTFVVQKKISQTPLTSRPVATEQCEITIENCCNMNICDTPCFDPKLLQQNLSYDNSMKEDKKTLINNMEEDLY